MDRVILFNCFLSPVASPPPPPTLVRMSLACTAMITPTLWLPVGRPCSLYACSADLSGQVLNRPLALEWGRRILEEFRLQARLEANTGLPRTTVASGDMETTIKGQHFFAVKVSTGVGVGDKEMFACAFVNT